MSKWKISGAAFVLCFGMAGPVAADGVHFWVDMGSQLVGDVTGNMSGLRMSWIFDKSASEALLDGENLDKSHLSVTLKTVSLRIVNDLRDRSYFARLSIDATPLKTATVTDYKLSLGQDNRLKLEFFLPLSKPQRLSGRKLDIAVADPSGTTVFVYPSAQVAATGMRWPGCAFSLEPHPNFSAGQPAQTVHLQCK